MLSLHQNNINYLKINIKKTMVEKKYGHFDDANREYVITDPKTPWPWINYLGNEDFFLPRGQGEGSEANHRRWQTY